MLISHKLSKEWQKSVWSEYSAIHAEYQNTLGNLTLLSTTKNTNYSNKSFIEKRDMEDGFKSSHLKINRWINE
ncbi:MAG: HNH endonuclease family protein [Desulfovibrionaceae bacterium]